MKPRIVAVLQKEFIHIWRDPYSLLIVFLFPMMMILLYGYAITFDIKYIPLAILDQDRSPASQQLVEKLTSSNYFRIAARLQDRREIEPGFLHRRMSAVLVIPNDFDRRLTSQPETSVQLIMDGANANTAMIAMNYLKSFLTRTTLELNQGLLATPLEIEPRIWYNPDLKSTHFVVPGLIAILMMMICAMLTSLTISRERETGTLEQIFVSPIRPVEIIIGKVAPYILLAFLDALAILGFSHWVFGVPIRGSLALLIFFMLIYIYASLSLGVFISSRTRTQQAALFAAMLGTLLPSVLLSGFVFPIASMPRVLQWVTCIVPAKYFLIQARGVMLKGVDFEYLYLPTVFLLIFGTLLLAVSVKRFKTNLEG